MAHRLTAALLLALAMLPPAAAAPFADPTRPPRLGAVETSSAAVRLESILIAPDRRIAIINGQQLTVGSRFGDGHVLQITESEVVIRRPQGDEALSLFPVDGKSAPARKER
jgi:MSHA biogenesis protein MshK